MPSRSSGQLNSFPKKQSPSTMGMRAGEKDEVQSCTKGDNWKFGCPYQSSNERSALVAVSGINTTEARQGPRCIFASLQVLNLGRRSMNCASRGVSNIG